MIKYAKLQNQNLIYAKLPLRIGNEDAFTNDSAIFLSQGYKKIVYTEPPETEGYYPEPKWTETETEIVQEWELIPLPPEEATDEDYLEALTEMGVNVDD